MKFSSFVLFAALIVQQTNAKCKTYDSVYDGTQSKEFMGYYSNNDVTDYAKVDLDVQTIADKFDEETDPAWVAAKQIYEEGGSGIEGSLQELSTNLDNLEGDDIPELLKQYIAYFGTASYGNTIVSAGFDPSVKTNLANGNIDLTTFTPEGGDPVSYGFKGREEVSKKGIQYLIAPMQMHVKMTEAINLLDNGDKVNAEIAWDAAVAYFVGSTFKDLFYVLGTKRCANFGTCNKEDDGVKKEDCAPPNDEIFLQFYKGQNGLKKNKSKKLKKSVDRIIKAYVIPLMQGTLRYSYKIGKGIYTDTPVDSVEAPLGDQLGQKENAEGYMFVVGTLPFIHECNAQVAADLYDAMKIRKQIFRQGEEVPSLDNDVKKYFAYVSSCTGVTCKDVGNQLNPVTVDGVEPEVVSSCLYPLEKPICRDSPMALFDRKGNGDLETCSELNDKDADKKAKYCKKKPVKKACKDVCKRKCKCDSDEKSNDNCKPVIKLKTVKDVIDYCIENPDLQTECPSACQGWCNDLKAGF